MNALHSLRKKMSEKFPGSIWQNSESAIAEDVTEAEITLVLQVIYSLKAVKQGAELFWHLGEEIIKNFGA